MKHEFWIERWQTGQIGFHQSEFDSLLVDFFPQLAPGKVLVPLCGKSRDLIWLAQQGHQVVGVELSPLACEAFFEENMQGEKVEIQEKGAFKIYRAGPYQIYCGDFFQLPPEELGHVDAIYDRASMIALPMDLRERYVQHLKSLSWGILFLITLEYPPGVIEGPPFAISIAEVERFYQDNFTVKRLHTQDVSADFTQNPRLCEARPTEHAFIISK